MQQSHVSELDQLVKLVDGLHEELMVAADAVATDLRIDGDVPVDVGVCALRRGTSQRSVRDRIAQDAARIQVLREAEYRHVRSGLTMAHVSVLFDEAVEIEPGRIDRLAGELVDLCAEHREQLFMGRRLTGAVAGGLPAGVDAVRVCQANPIRRTCWTGTTADWFDAIEIDHVQHALDAGCEQIVGASASNGSKAALPEAADERWVVLMTSADEAMELPAHVMEHAYETLASRAFVVMPGGALPTELEIVTSPAA